MKTKTTFKALLASLGRTQYTNDEAVETVTPCAEQKIEFFTLGKYVLAKDLKAEAEKLGFELASPYALALYVQEMRDFADDKYIATQWEKDGQLYYAAFRRGGGGRGLRVGRDGSGGWSGSWWFAGVRKSSPLPSETETLASLSALSLRVKNLEDWASNVGYKMPKV